LYEEGLKEVLVKQGAHRVVELIESRPLEVAGTYRVIHSDTWEEMWVPESDGQMKS